MSPAIDTGYGETEIGVELVGDPKGIGLDRQLEQLGVAVEGSGGFNDPEKSQVVFRKLDPTKLMGPASNQSHRPHRRAPRANGLDEHRLVEERPDKELTFFRNGRRVHVGRSTFHCNPFFRRKGPFTAAGPLPSFDFFLRFGLTLL
jgi:hypothetical protein